MNSKIVISLLSGLVIGGIGGFFAGRWFEKRKRIGHDDDDQNETTKTYEELIDPYVRIEHDDDDQNGQERDREQLREDLKRMRKEESNITDYHNMYHEHGDTAFETILAESEHPEEGEDSEDDEITDKIGKLEQEAFDEHQKNMNRPPEIISADDAANLPAYYISTLLYYYTEDDVVVEDGINGETVVDCPELLIGDALTQYDFVDSDENILFVLNYTQDTCYEIQKIRDQYHDDEY